MKQTEYYLKKFDKEVVDYFWNKETTVGTQRLSINHIEKIKSFLKSVLEETARSMVLRKMDWEALDKSEKETRWFNRGYNKAVKEQQTKLNKLLE